MQTPADYVRESSIARLAAQGKKLLDEHRATLDAIERQFGVPPSVLLAIWGRETAYGGYKLPHDAIRVLATQAYTGRRKDMFRGEFLAALKMLQDGVPREKMRSSWGGAMGLTQFLPSEFYKHAVDFDGDGKVDIWTSIPDALASAAKQLANKGWQRGERWAYEVRMPAGVDCTIAQPGHVMPIGEWLKRGYAPAYGRKLSRRRTEERRFAAAAGRHLWSGVPDAEELFRHQGLQFLRPLRAVRRPSQRPHPGCARRSRSRGARTRSFAPSRSRRCSARSPSAGSTATRSTARPAC